VLAKLNALNIAHPPPPAIPRSSGAPISTPRYPATAEEVEDFLADKSPTSARN